MCQWLTQLLLLYALVGEVYAIGQATCVLFESTSSSFPVVSRGSAAPVILSSDDWPGVHRAASDFVADIQRVTQVKPSLTNATSSSLQKTTSRPIIIGTLGKSSLIEKIVNNTQLDVSSVRGQWEAFMAREVKEPLPGIDSAYVIIGADKRGTIFALYDHSEQFGVSPWYWWADVPIKKHAELFVDSSGCSHGSPTVKYRGIFLNDEQPALQSWAAERFTNGTGAALTGSPFNRFFYTKLFELMLRIKSNYLWPAIWSSAFAIDNSQNQPLADYYGVVMGTSHQEPMMRSTPIEFNLFEHGDWNYTTNAQNIYNYWVDGTKRAKPFESIFTLGMRGAGDLPLSETTNIDLLEKVIADQTQILGAVFGNDTEVSAIPQIWALYKEVEGYYEDGLRVPDYVTLLWSDDNWGNVRRYPTQSERNRTGGAGVYYHVCTVGDPRDYKWIAVSFEVDPIYEQMSLAVDRVATRVWILNVGDLKPYERETEFFITLGWNSTRWNPDNLHSFVTAWAQREFDMNDADASRVVEVVANLTRFNARRKPELLNSTTYSLISYREAEQIITEWQNLETASTSLYNKLPSSTKPAFFQLVHHPVLASSNLGQMLIKAGMNNLRASQARLSTNNLADEVEQAFEHDFDLEEQYHQLLNGASDIHIGYYYWQQPMTNTMPVITRVQSRKQALPGVMRIAPEGTVAAWPGDNPNQCAQGFSCPPPTMMIDSLDPIPNKFVDVGASGPASFTFTVKSNASWLEVSPSSGSVSPKSPETRVFISVKNWNELSEGMNAATLTFTAIDTSNSKQKQPSMSFPVNIQAVRNTVAREFTGGLLFNALFWAALMGEIGFVEGAGVVSIEAAHATRNSTVSGVFWRELPGYGRTISGVTPWPRTGASDNGFPNGSGPTLEYDFFTFNPIRQATVFVSPSLNANGQDRPLLFSVQLDDGNVQQLQPIPSAPSGSLPQAWNGVDGFVANAMVAVKVPLQAQPGKHTLKIGMIEPAVVVQKIVIDAGGLKPSYLGPPESMMV
ncbi:glycoside hydrolase family 115 protein [Amanita thiersii Skay4041]|uniref:Glycoside hydrolase family 115 protein n=1 Tax=Amanita thiersii Skay4041 TaxID=703135 RepID=A0A2A9NCP7_9AGAR|nr:glycoside hydrolase family 115 protein [Amanita thiersii Skay4041]